MPNRPGLLARTVGAASFAVTFIVFATLIGGSLAASVLIDLGFQLAETKRNVETIHHQMAELAAVRIQDYVEDISQALHLAAAPRQLDDHHLTDDYAFNLRTLLKNAPAVRDVFAVGLDGREQLRESRIAPSVPNTGIDHSAEPFFTAARAGKTYYGPIIFPPDSLEPRIIHIRSDRSLRRRRGGRARGGSQCPLRLGRCAGDQDRKIRLRLCRQRRRHPGRASRSPARPAAQGSLSTCPKSPPCGRPMPARAGPGCTRVSAGSRCWSHTSAFKTSDGPFSSNGR